MIIYKTDLQVSIISKTKWSYLTLFLLKTREYMKKSKSSHFNISCDYALIDLDKKIIEKFGLPLTINSQAKQEKQY